MEEGIEGAEGKERRGRRGMMKEAERRKRRMVETEHGIGAVDLLSLTADQSTQS